MLEYCTPAWSPHYVTDKAMLERAQRRFTRMVPGLRRLEYDARLKELGLWTLEERRNRADLIETFKILNGLSGIVANTLFEISVDSRTRGHSLKLSKNRCNSDLRKYFFSERVINRWNKLKQQSVAAKTINIFKSALKTEREAVQGFFIDD